VRGPVSRWVHGAYLVIAFIELYSKGDLQTWLVGTPQAIGLKCTQFEVWISVRPWVADG
jgi:hypothetical protein